MTNTLVLAAHGSVIDGSHNQPLFDLADELETKFSTHDPAFKHFNRVTPGFLNGQPNLTNVLEQIPAGNAGATQNLVATRNVVVVPIMTSEGYYYSTLPDKLNQNQNRAEFEISITRVLGTHESLPRRISQRITNLISQFHIRTSETTVVVIGHGTRRNRSSCHTTLELTRQLSLRHPGLKFESAFLDQSPSITSVANRIKTANTIIIPFLIGRGPHSTHDIPAAFGLPTRLDVPFPISGKQSTNRAAGICICDLPVGLYPDLAEVCLSLATSLANEKRPPLNPTLPADLFPETGITNHGAQSTNEVSIR